MSLQYLLDTSVISATLWKPPDTGVIEKLDQLRSQCAISAPGWNELVYGMERLPAGKRRNELEDFLMDVVRVEFRILPYDERAAMWHARQRARLESVGRMPPFIDGQIAAVAWVNNLVLVTRDEKDFVAFTGLEVQSWRE